jgi:hypothetical protein
MGGDRQRHGLFHSDPDAPPVIELLEWYRFRPQQVTS